jgi:L-threonylcarbamoyladenylate synthase
MPCPPSTWAGEGRTLLDQAPTEVFLRDMAAAVQHLREHGVVALPTDTRYGLAADVFDEPALARLREIKGNPEGLALTVMIANWEQMARVTQELPPMALRLARLFWPGPLTLIVPKAAWLPDVITGGRATVSLRMPGHRVPVGLATELGRPIAAASAIERGQAEVQSLEELAALVGPRVSYVVSSGPPPKGVSSTVVDVTTNTPLLLRHGDPPFQQVLQAANGR